MRDRNLGLLFAAGGFYNMGQMNFFAYLTLFMREAAQASQPVAGLSLAIAQAASAVARPRGARQRWVSSKPACLSAVCWRQAMAPW